MALCGSNEQAACGDWRGLLFLSMRKGDLVVLITAALVSVYSIVVLQSSSSDDGYLRPFPTLLPDDGTEPNVRRESSVWRLTKRPPSGAEISRAVPAAVVLSPMAGSKKPALQAHAARHAADEASSVMKLPQFPENCTEVGTPCFGVLAGIDMAPGRENDLAILKGVSLQFCADACLQRNKMVDEAGTEGEAMGRCLAIVIAGRTCWLKRSNELSETRMRVNSLVLGLTELPLRSTTREKLSVLFGVLTEHHFVKERLLPAFRSWLAEEDVLLLLDESTEVDRNATEDALRPFLRCETRPNAVRHLHYMKKMDRLATAAEASRERLRVLGERLGGKVLINTVDGKMQQRGLEDALRKALVAQHGANAANGLVQRQLQAMLSHREFRLPGQSGAWKNLPGVYHMFRLFPNFSYYMMVDDDSFFIQRNFNILMSSFYLPRKNPMVDRVYAGQFSAWYEPVSQGTQKRYSVTLFQQGGSGILMSRATVEHVFEIVNADCRLKCDYLPHGDVRLGCCMALAGIHGTQESTLWHMNIYRAQGRDMRQFNSLFPVSFHRMKNESMMGQLQQCVDEAFDTIDRASKPYEVVPMRWVDITKFYAPLRTNETEYKYHSDSLS